MQITEKINRSDEVYNQLLSMIATGEWAPGQKLPSENKLCEILGVSRNTVRSATSKLVALGLIESKQGSGCCVRDLSTGIYLNSLLPLIVLRSNDLVPVTELRIGMESQAAYLAAVSATEEDIANIKKMLDISAEHIADREVFAKDDMMFHLEVAKASHNQLFIGLTEMLLQVYTVWLTNFQRIHGTERSFNFHTQIYEAIRDRRKDDACELMRNHLIDVLNKIKMDSDRKNQLKG